MKTMQEIANQNQINEDLAKQYDDIINCIKKQKKITFQLKKVFSAQYLVVLLVLQQDRQL